MRHSLKPLLLGCFLLPLFVGGAVNAGEITNLDQCHAAVKDAEQAINENPTLGEKASKVLGAVMELAKKRCEEQQFSNANDLLELAKGMVASE